MVAQLAHAVPGIEPRTQQPGFVGGVQEAQVPELFPGGPGDGPGLLLQHLRRHLVAPQLIQQIQHLLQKGRFPGGAAVHPQHRGHFPHSLLQCQELAAGIQRYLGKAPGNAQHPVP